MAEQLIVYGVSCVWWDKAERAATRTVPVPDDLSPEFKRQLAGRRQPRLPCCPKCGCALMQIEESKWWKNVQNYEDGKQDDGEKHPGYRKLMEWLQGRCFPDFTTARLAYARVAVKPS